MADMVQKEVTITSADTALVTTAETAVVSSPVMSVPKNSCRCLVKGWAQLTTGTNTTSVKPRIRRGADATGTLVNEANIEQVKAAAGSTEFFVSWAVDERQNVGSVQYTLTLEQAGASANGSCLQAGIEVEILEG